MSHLPLDLADERVWEHMSVGGPAILKLGAVELEPRVEDRHRRDGTRRRSPVFRVTAHTPSATSPSARTN